MYWKMESYMKFILYLGVMAVTSMFVINPPPNNRVKDYYVVKNQPLQKKTASRSFIHKGYQIKPLADIALEARVLSYQTYSSDKESELSPIDLALGWGPMSKESVISEIDISQKGRWYFWETQNFPVSRKAIENNSANMHIIPANRLLAESLMDVQEGDIIRLKGFLVECSQGNWKWKSSLTRNDTGDGACEVIYITDFKVHQPPKKL